MLDGKTLKEQLFSHCQKKIQEREAMLRRQLESLEESRNEETKSSVGDKYETGRAMVQKEIDQVKRQLSQVLQEKMQLEKVDLGRGTVARTGSLVETNNGLYLLSIGLGRMTVDGTLIYCISPQAPVGLALLGAKVGDTPSFNGRSLLIKAIY